MTDDSTGSSPSQPSDALPNGRVSPGGGVRPLPFQVLVNRVVRGLLRVPLLSRVVGSRLMTLYVVGRKSGKLYTVPMAYLRYEGALLLGSGFAWGKNLRTGDTVEVRFMGRRRSADVRVLKDEAAVVEHYAVIAQHNPGFARINNIGFSEDGQPDTHDLHSAWAAGARVFLLTLR